MREAVRGAASVSIPKHNGQDLEKGRKLRVRIFYSSAHPKGPLVGTGEAVVVASTLHVVLNPCNPFFVPNDLSYEEMSPK